MCRSQQSQSELGLVSWVQPSSVMNSVAEPATRPFTHRARFSIHTHPQDGNSHSSSSEQGADGGACVDNAGEHSMDTEGCIGGKEGKERECKHKSMDTAGGNHNDHGRGRDEGEEGHTEDFYCLRTNLDRMRAEVSSSASASPSSSTSSSVSAPLAGGLALADCMQGGGWGVGGCSNDPDHLFTRASAQVSGGRPRDALCSF